MQKSPGLRAALTRKFLRPACDRLATFGRDRRGATAVVFALTAVAVVGMAGLGTEGGSWYLTRRDAQNAADPAAYAGAVRLALAQGTLGLPLAPGARGQAQTAAVSVATANLFTTGTNATVVTVNTPPATGPNTGNATAVEVIIDRTRTRQISGLFLASNPTIRVRGVAALVQNGSACLLALPGFGTGTVTGQLLAGGNSTVTAPQCILASNSARGDAVAITGSSSVTAQSITTPGGCTGCTAATLSQPATPFSPPTVNPLAYLNSKVLPTFNNGSCYSSPVYNPGGGVIPGGIPNNINNSMVIPPPPTGRALCGLKVNAGAVVTLNPGVYYFYNSSFVASGGTIQCRVATSPPTANGAPCTGGRGVTIVFTGSPGQIGGPDINGNATVVLSAPNAANASDPDYAGILFFRDPRATGGNGQGNPAVNINGGAGTSLTGAMYFPNSYVKFNGNADVNSCNLLVGGTVEMTGNMGLRIDQCASLGFGNLVPTVQIVRLVE